MLLAQGIKTRYAKLTPKDLLEGNDQNLGYVSMMDDVLTINEENRLRKQVEEMQIEKSEVDALKAEFAKLRASLNLAQR